jgi:hypothetical protein
MTAEERAERDGRRAQGRSPAPRTPTPCGATATCWRAFRDEERHDKAREAALDDIVRLAMTRPALRVKELAAERKPLLDDESEFYRQACCRPS